MVCVCDEISRLSSLWNNNLSFFYLLIFSGSEKQIVELHVNSFNCAWVKILSVIYLLVKLKNAFVI